MKPPKTRQEWLTDEDLAEILGQTPEAIRARVRAGVEAGGLPGREVRLGRTLTRWIDFDAWIADPPPIMRKETPSSPARLDGVTGDNYDETSKNRDRNLPAPRWKIQASCDGHRSDDGQDRSPETHSTSRDNAQGSTSGSAHTQGRDPERERSGQRPNPKADRAGLLQAVAAKQG